MARLGKTLRFPTFPEQRFMTYEAIINSARGLVYFGGGLPTTLSEDDREYGWNWTYWDRVLHPVIEEIGDRSPLAAAPPPRARSYRSTPRGRGSNGACGKLARTCSSWRAVGDRERRLKLDLPACRPKFAWAK